MILQQPTKLLIDCGLTVGWCSFLLFQLLGEYESLGKEHERVKVGTQWIIKNLNMQTFWYYSMDLAELT